MVDPHPAPDSSSRAQLETRLAFIELDSGAREKIRGISDVLAAELPKALNKFYERLRVEPKVRDFFSNEAHIARAKGAQSQHWEGIGAGRFDEAYMSNVRRVGMTHARIGLEPKWYIGGYAIIFDHLVKSLVASRWPKGMFGRGNSGDLGAAIGALAKAVFLDMDIAISVYLEELEAQWRRAEDAKRAADAEVQSALNATAAALGRLASKDLQCEIRADLPGAFAKLAEDFNAAVGALRHTMLMVADGASAIRGGSDEISSATDDLSRRTELQAANIEESAAAIEQVTATVNKSVEGAQHARTIVSGVKEKSRQSGEVVGRAVEAMGRIEKSSGEIGRIISVVDEIAFQTNLLALNAGVEAARAGEAGRGFAVVASEVRALAQRSADAAKDIKSLVTASNAEVRAGVKLVADSGALLNDIVVGVEQIDHLIGDIASGAQEQARALTEVNTAVAELDHATQQNAAMSEQTTAATGALTRETARLAGLVGEFGLGATPKAVAPARATKPAAAPAKFPPSKSTPPRAKPARAASGGAAAAATDWSEF